MQREARNQQISQLKQNGFKMVKDYPYLYINKTGSVYSFRTCGYLKTDTKNSINAENKRLSVPKLILQTFKGETYRAGQIKYIDGNKANITAENIKYRRVFSPDINPESLNNNNIMTVIRCYFQVEKKFKVRDSFRMKMYLNAIADKRQFFIDKSKLQYIEVFKTYMNSNNTIKNANTYGLTIRDYSIIINKFKNMLIGEVLQDIETGKLKVLDFKTKRHSKTQVKSVDEKLKDFERKLNEYKEQVREPQ